MGERFHGQGIRIAAAFLMNLQHEDTFDKIQSAASQIKARQAIGRGSYDSRSLFSLQGSIFPKVFLRSLVVGVGSGLSAVLTFEFAQDFFLKNLGSNNNTDIHSYLSVIVGLLLVFRTSIAYGRYDHGVTTSGQLKSYT